MRPFLSIKDMKIIRLRLRHHDDEDANRIREALQLEIEHRQRGNRLLHKLRKAKTQK